MLILLMFLACAEPDPIENQGCAPITQHCQGFDQVDPTPIEIPDGCGVVDVSVLYETEDEPKTVTVEVIENTVTPYCFTEGRVTVTLAGNEVDGD